MSFLFDLKWSKPNGFTNTCLFLHGFMSPCEVSTSLHELILDLLRTVFNHFLLKKNHEFMNNCFTCLNLTMLWMQQICTAINIKQQTNLINFADRKSFYCNTYYTRSNYSRDYTIFRIAWILNLPALSPILTNKKF